MRQQINLFQPIFRQPKPLFSALALAQVWGLVALSMVGMQVYLHVRLLELESREAGLQRDRGVAERRLTELMERLPKRKPDPGLVTRTAALEEQLAQTRRVAEALEGGASGNTEGLSSYLVALARQHVPGTWLTHVEVAQGGSAVGLGGRTQAPELVPEYLLKLRQEPAFQGKQFSRLEVARVEDAGGFGFALGTSGSQGGLGAVGDKAAGGAHAQP